MDKPPQPLSGTSFFSYSTVLPGHLWGLKAADRKKEEKIRPELRTHTARGRRTSEAQTPQRPWVSGRRATAGARRVRLGRSGSASGSVLLPPPRPTLSARRLPAWPLRRPSSSLPPLRPASLVLSPPSSLLPLLPDTPAQKSARRRTGQYFLRRRRWAQCSHSPDRPDRPRASPPALARRSLADLRAARRPRSTPAFPSAPEARPPPPGSPSTLLAPAPALAGAHRGSPGFEPGGPGERRGKSGVGPGCGVKAGVRRGRRGGERPAALASLPGNPRNRVGDAGGRPRSPGRSWCPGRVATIRGILGSRVRDRSAWELFPWVAEWL